MSTCTHDPPCLIWLRPAGDRHVCQLTDSELERAWAVLVSLTGEMATRSAAEREVFFAMGQAIRYAMAARGLAGHK